MSDAISPAGAEALIRRLGADLRPVARLAPVWQFVAAWLGGVVWLGLLLSFFADFARLRAQMMGAPDMWMAETGAALTAVLAGVAAFQTSIPGRSSRWSLLPLPALGLWVAASTMGCLRQTAIAGVVPEPPMHGMACSSFVLLVGLPLGGWLIWLLTRAFPLRPGLTAALGGLASAGAASVLLSLVHPFDATAEDLLFHLVAVGMVVGACRVFGKVTLAGRTKGSASF